MDRLEKGHQHAPTHGLVMPGTVLGAPCYIQALLFGQGPFSLHSGWRQGPARGHPGAGPELAVPSPRPAQPSAFSERNIVFPQPSPCRIPFLPQSLGPQAAVQPALCEQTPVTHGFVRKPH